MLRPVYLNSFRAIAALVILMVATLPIFTTVTQHSSLLLYPSLVVVSLVVFAVIEQRLLRVVDKHYRTNHQRKHTQIHKTKFKPVRAHKHAGCKLLGLACAA